MSSELKRLRKAHDKLGKEIKNRMDEIEKKTEETKNLIEQRETITQKIMSEEVEE